MNQLCYYVVQTNGAPMRTIESKLSHPPLTRSARQTWVQTDRAAHEAWGHLVHKSPRAAALMHHLVAHMDQSAAVVASYATLAKICGFSVATVRRAVDDLKSRQWIQVVQIGGKGAANAFVVNSRVAWAANRDMLLWRHSQPEFSQVQTSKMQKHWMARLFDVSRFSGQVKGNYLLAQVKIRRVSLQSKAWSRIYRACRPSKSSKVTRFPNGPAGRATASTHA